MNYLKKARGYDNYNIVFAIDKYGHPGQEQLLEIVNAFCVNHLGIASIISEKQSVGLTRNILGGYQHCFPMSEDFVIIIEDDIRISADFFEYIEHCFENFVDENTLAITGYCSKVRGTVEEVFQMGHYYSLGSAVIKDKFEKYVLPHCTFDYYFNRNKYMVDTFPDIMVDRHGVATHNEQAGLHQRILKHNGFHMIAPHVPRVQHFGCLGGNRRSKIDNASFEIQVAALKDAMDDPKKLAALETTTFKDYVITQDDHDWNKLRMVSHENIS